MKESILGFVRHFLTFGGGFAVSGGYASQDETTQLVGGIVTVIGVLWSVIDKILTKKKASE